MLEGCRQYTTPYRNDVTNFISVKQIVALDEKRFFRHGKEPDDCGVGRSLC